MPSFGQVCLCAERVGMLWSQGLLTYIQDMTIHGFAVFLGLRKAGLKWITYHGGWCLRGEPPTSSWLMGHGHSETTVSVVLWSCQAPHLRLQSSLSSNRCYQSVGGNLNDVEVDNTNHSISLSLRTMIQLHVLSKLSRCPFIAYQGAKLNFDEVTSPCSVPNCASIFLHTSVCNFSASWNLRLRQALTHNSYTNNRLLMNWIQVTAGILHRGQPNCFELAAHIDFPKVGLRLG